MQSNRGVPHAFQSSPAASPTRYLPALLLLFALSGCSALIYEIVWYQLLQLVIGSTAVSLGVLLATFMGGLCLGSLAVATGGLARRLHPLRVYAYVELGIGAAGSLVLLVMPLRTTFTWREWVTACRPFCCERWSRRCACCRRRC